MSKNKITKIFNPYKDVCQDYYWTIENCLNSKNGLKLSCDESNYLNIINSNEMITILIKPNIIFYENTKQNLPLRTNEFGEIPFFPVYRKEQYFLCFDNFCFETLINFKTIDISDSFPEEVKLTDYIEIKIDKTNSKEVAKIIKLMSYIIDHNTVSFLIKRKERCEYRKDFEKSNYLNMNNQLINKFNDQLINELLWIKDKYNREDKNSTLDMVKMQLIYYMSYCELSNKYTKKLTNHNLKYADLEKLDIDKAVNKLLELISIKNSLDKDIIEFLSVPCSIFFETEDNTNPFLYENRDFTLSSLRSGMYDICEQDGKIVNDNNNCLLSLHNIKIKILEIQENNK